MLPELHLWSTKTSCSCSCSLEGCLTSRDAVSSEMVHCGARNPLAVPLQAWDKAALKCPSKWTWTVKVLHLTHVLDSSRFVCCDTPASSPLGKHRGTEEAKSVFSVPKWEAKKKSALSDAVSVSHRFHSAYGTPVAPMGLNLAIECHLWSHSYLKSPMGLQKLGT